MGVRYESAHLSPAVSYDLPANRSAQRMTILLELSKRDRRNGR